MFLEVELLTIILSYFQAGYGLGDEDESLSMGGKLCAHVASSYIVNLRDMDMKHIKDFVFLHGKQFLPIQFFPSFRMYEIVPVLKSLL